MSKVLRFAHETTSARLVVWNNGYGTLFNLYSVKKRQGNATRLMCKIIEYADLHGLILLLEVDKYGNSGGLDNTGLERFYGRFGFVDCGPDMMERLPSQ